MQKHGGITPGTCEGRSCLKWERSGELSALDHQRIVELLCAVDQRNCPDQPQFDLKQAC